MKHLFPLLFLLVVLGAVLWAQSDTAPSFEAALDGFIYEENFRAAVTLIDTARDEKTRAERWRFFGKKAIEQAERHYDANDFGQALRLLEKAIRTVEEAGRADSLPTAALWTWKALSHRALEQYADVLDAYKEAIRIYELHGSNSPGVAYCYKNAAQVYIRRQDYEQAGKYLQAAIRSDSTQSQLLSIISQLANNAYWQDSFELALHYVEQGKKIKGPRSALTALLSVETSVMIKRQQWREAENILRRALTYYEKESDETDNRIRTYAALADIAAHTGRPRQSEMYYRKAEKEGLAYYKGKSREMAKLYCEWGDFLLGQNGNQEALQYYQKALVQTFPNFNNLAPAANPDLREAPLELWAMNAAARKAAVLLFGQPKLENRDLAADCFDLAFAVAQRLRRAYGTDEAKLYFARHNYNLRLEAVRNLWAAYRASGQTHHLHRLFALLEDSRANALRDALQQQRALALAGIPDSLLQLEDALRRERAATQTRLSDAESQKDTAKSAYLQASLFQIERRYDELLSFLKNRYTQFQHYEQADETANLATVSAALPDSAALLSWFDAGDRYICVVARHTGLGAFEVERDSLFEKVFARFLDLLPDKSRQESDPATCFSDAYFLFQKLLPDSAISNARALIVIPDERLCYLPFEALLTAPHEGGYAKAPYLLHSKSVQYAWSATLLTLRAVEKPGEKGLLHVAPFVHATRDGLALLPNSLRDAPQDLVATALEGEKASADLFLRIAPQYNILHLSTHADAGSRAEPGIELYDRRLSVAEIYAQRFRASLVSLSACETGKGQFAEGEGVLSLARAFAYAGAQSLVAGHWAVNERSTAELFSAFYQNLQKGLPKAEALRQAKRQYLASSEMDARKAPFHWAAFTLTGLDGQATLTANDGWTKWLLWLSAIALAALGARWLYSFVTAFRKKKFELQKGAKEET